METLRDAGLPDDFFLDRLRRIERDINVARNRARHAMNGALIAIGIRNETLAAAALETAARIGTVVVDHGATGCKTPEAIPYIRKAWARKAAMKK
ncbi:MAG: hypothetical protein HYV63_07965 [Candidatus Schekmanbacteria bacterium]|nr:hypothetical protein [Candidatus Schekmanbacteria bacterium]